MIQVAKQRAPGRIPPASASRAPLDILRFAAIRPLGELAANSRWTYSSR
jgi:hypothetical protein